MHAQNATRICVPIHGVHLCVDHWFVIINVQFQRQSQFSISIPNAPPFHKSKGTLSQRLARVSFGEIAQTRRKSIDLISAIANADIDPKLETVRLWEIPQIHTLQGASRRPHLCRWTLLWLLLLSSRFHLWYYRTRKFARSAVMAIPIYAMERPRCEEISKFLQSLKFSNYLEGIKFGTILSILNGLFIYFSTLAILGCL